LAGGLDFDAGLAVGFGSYGGVLDFDDVLLAFKGGEWGQVDGLSEIGLADDEDALDVAGAFDGDGGGEDLDRFDGGGRRGIVGVGSGGRRGTTEDGYSRDHQETSNPFSHASHQRLLLIHSCHRHRHKFSNYFSAGNFADAHDTVIPGGIESLAIRRED